MLLIIWLDTANRPQSWLSNYFVDFIDRTLEIKHLKINLSDIRRKKLYNKRGQKMSNCFLENPRQSLFKIPKMLLIGKSGEKENLMNSKN